MVLGRVAVGTLFMRDRTLVFSTLIYDRICDVAFHAIAQYFVTVILLPWNTNRKL